MDTTNSKVEDACKHNESDVRLFMKVVVNHRYEPEGMLQKILDSGVNVDAKDRYGCTTLMMAVDLCNSTSTKDAVRLLLCAGANPNAVDNDGRVVLDYALDKSYDERDTIDEDIVQLLIDAGAFVNRSLSIPTISKPFLFYVIEHTNPVSITLARMLIRAGADVNAKYNNVSILVTCLDKLGQKYTDEMGMMIRMLLSYGANPRCHISKKLFTTNKRNDRLTFILLSMRVKEFQIYGNMYKKCLKCLCRKRARMTSIPDSMGAKIIICNLAHRSDQTPSISDEMVDYLGIRDKDTPVEIAEYVNCLSESFDIIE